MPPRSQLEIQTSSVIRLAKEAESYHRELLEQEARIEKLKTSPSDDENHEYLLKQEAGALEETKKVLPTLKKKIIDTVAVLQTLIEEEGQKGAESNVAHITAAKEAIAQSKVAEREVS
ncbi:Tubulin binding cofactor A [Penicillium macrosclerotiorum]|uniref:Tubulin binding cofactor A n=1 Tax=Penicillium macrosclerotiorum TaxID=303699 RepID=UPI002549C0D7|nr:Tubulin binding cofactor A [Penicillium macrosclerotiorum]KAJ5668917.1 Tubulin binding cofactor A [Penicillium macrosclerotiorum]